MKVWSVRKGAYVCNNCGSLYTPNERYYSENDTICNNCFCPEHANEPLMTQVTEYIKKNKRKINWNKEGF